MQKNQSPVTGAGTVLRVETKPMLATLTKRVRRIKPSLAGFHYHLEIGSMVYIADWQGRNVRASEVADPSQRIPEDYFDLEFGSFELVTINPEWEKLTPAHDVIFPDFTPVNISPKAIHE